MNTFKHFDLPVKHLEATSEHYVPPKAREASEIERRKELIPGVLMAEYQQRGITVAMHILEYAINQEDTLFITKTLAAASLNTAWHNYAQGARGVMRRCIKLPDYTEVEETITKEDLIDDAIGQMTIAELTATRLAQDGREKRKLYVKHKKAIGLSLGNAAIVLANAPHAEVLNYLKVDPEYQQLVARQTALEVLEDSRTLYKVVGSNPTLAQLADGDSPLSVYWRRNATDLAYDALEHAKEVTS